MHNITADGRREIPRTGEEILQDMGPFPANLARFVNTMRGISREEIPGFTETFSRRHPRFAAAMVNFVLDLAEMAPGTDLVWAECLAKMPTDRASIIPFYKMNDDRAYAAAGQATQQAVAQTAL